MRMERRSILISLSRCHLHHGILMPKNLTRNDSALCEQRNQQREAKNTRTCFFFQVYQKVVQLLAMKTLHVVQIRLWLTIVHQQATIHKCSLRCFLHNSNNEDY